MSRFARTLGLLALSAGALAHYRVKSAALDPSLFAYAGKAFAQAAAPALLVAGAAGAVVGLASGDAPAAAAGAAGALLLGRYLAGVLTASLRTNLTAGVAPGGTGPRWASMNIGAAGQRMAACFQHDRDETTGRGFPQARPGNRGPRVQQNVAFWQVPSAAIAPAAQTSLPADDSSSGPNPGGEGRLLCDVWQPPPGVPPSGLGMIYLHAGGWQNFDKDTGTRPFFRRLAGRGHVVMDVAYRLCADTDMWGMLGDVKRAVAWLKAEGPAFGVDPARIVLCGASAGGHLALLAAYTANQQRFHPPDLAGADTAVCAVCSYYGVPDMLRFGVGPAHPDWPSFVRWGRKLGIVTKRAYMAWPDVERQLFGARAHEVPEIAALLSPLNHVGLHCPPTLLVHGSHDRVVGVDQARDLYAALRAHGAPAAYLELPRVDHAFDLIAPQISPSAQRAWDTLERFLEVAGFSRASQS